MAKALSTQASGILIENGDLASTSAGASSVGDVPLLNANGLLDTSFFLNNVAPTVVQLASDVSTTATAATNITGLSFTISSTGTYRFELWVSYTAGTTTTGIRYGVNGPTSSFIQYSCQVFSNTGTVSYSQASAFGTTPAGATASSGANRMSAYVRGMFTATATGTLQFLHSSSSLGSTITTKANTFALLYKVT